jgi:hypothetical protein
MKPFVEQTVMNRLASPDGPNPSEFTKESQIYEWLCQEMMSVQDGPVYEFQGLKWRQMFGFRYAFNILGFFQCEDGRWAIDVNEFPPENFNPNMGIYPSYELMLEGVTRRYAELWKVIIGE